MQKIVSLYQTLLTCLCLLRTVVMLIARLWIAHVFFASGLVKIEDFSNTVALFEQEYMVPLLHPMFAAFSATFFELVCSALLAVGLGARFAALPLLAMTAVIQFTYDQNIQHTYWAILLGMIVAYGPGKLSLDYFIAKKFLPKREQA